MTARAGRATSDVWDGQALTEGLAAATDWLHANRDRVNALNVFPVPDGDTGTNMAQTMRSALDEVRALDASGGTNAGQVAAKAAHGALMGAQGNSGVILSQVWRGFAREVGKRPEIDGRDLARALAGAREMAYSAVLDPVEGTMLTVVRAAAERAAAVADSAVSAPAVLAEALAGARQSLAATPDLLDILKQAGVVDAGGQGIVLILEGFDYAARGEAVPTTAMPGDANLAARMPFLDRIADLHGDDAFGYCTNFMIVGADIDVSRVRADLSELGRSAVIVGDDTIAKVHIHALNPGRILDYALRWGELGQIKIDNMHAQIDSLTSERRHAPAVPGPNSPAPQISRQAVLAVASGAGLAEALRSMGAASIIAGGHSMNPSVSAMLAAVEEVAADKVILLPNNANVVMAANQVADLTTKRVRVAPSRSVPQGLAALSAFNVDAEMAANVAAMTDAIQSARTIEITRAEKYARIDGVTVERGQIIGLLNDRLAGSGETVDSVVLGALAQAGASDAELLTIFAGGAARAEETARLRTRIEGEYSHLTIEVYDGGQPHYLYVIAVE